MHATKIYEMQTKPQAIVACYHTSHPQIHNVTAPSTSTKKSTSSIRMTKHFNNQSKAQSNPPTLTFETLFENDLARCPRREQGERERKRQQRRSAHLGDAQKSRTSKPIEQRATTGAARAGRSRATRMRTYASSGAQSGHHVAPIDRKMEGNGSTSGFMRALVLLLGELRQTGRRIQTAAEAACRIPRRPNCQRSATVVFGRQLPAFSSKLQFAALSDAILGPHSAIVFPHDTGLRSGRPPHS